MNSTDSHIQNYQEKMCIFIEIMFVFYYFVLMHICLGVHTHACKHIYASYRSRKSGISRNYQLYVWDKLSHWDLELTE